MPTMREILLGAKEARDQEILYYDININNYTRAIAKLDAAGPSGDEALDTAMQAHRARLAELLGTEKIERAKSQLMLDTIDDQISELSEE